MHNIPFVGKTLKEMGLPAEPNEIVGRTFNFEFTNEGTRSFTIDDGTYLVCGTISAVYARTDDPIKGKVAATLSVADCYFGPNLKLVCMTYEEGYWKAKLKDDRTLWTRFWTNPFLGNRYIVGKLFVNDEQERRAAA